MTTRYNVTGTADYALVPLAGGPPVAERHGAGDHRLQRARDGDRLGLREPRRQRDAERRLAVDLADRIVQRLALSAGDWM